MVISLIAAVSANNVIGAAGELPWYLPEDLKHFKATTMGKPMIMGRNTFESIGRALPGRRSIILTRQEGYTAADCDIAKTPNEALALAGDAAEVMVIGGGKVYEAFLPLAKRIYLTRVHIGIDGDTFFPRLDENVWCVTSSEDYPAVDGREIGFSLQLLERTEAKVGRPGV